MIEGNSAASAARRCIINNCTIASCQDTMLANVNASQGYFYNSLIMGNFDYIWGGGDVSSPTAKSGPSVASAQPQLDRGADG